MNSKTTLTLVAALLATAAISAQQTSQTQPQVPQKTENPCAPRQESGMEKYAKAKAGRILGGLFNKGNQTIQKETKGNAPPITPNDLPKQAPKPCKAPAVTTPPTNQ